MKTTETSTSLLLLCLLLNRAPTAAQSPQPRPFAQVEKNKYAIWSDRLLLINPLHLDSTDVILFTGNGDCLEHGYVLNSRYQVVYPFPTFQPAFQLKKDQVILLNTSYSLVACGISLCPGNTFHSFMTLAHASNHITIYCILFPNTNIQWCVPFYLGQVHDPLSQNFGSQKSEEPRQPQVCDPTWQTLIGFCVIRSVFHHVLFELLRFVSCRQAGSDIADPLH